MSKLSHCLLLSFIAIAFVQPSYSAALRARSTATQFNYAKTFIDNAFEDIQKAKIAINRESLPSEVFCLSGDDTNYISYGKEAGKFGISDFSVGLWIQTTETGLRIFDVIGNRVPNGHGNFFQIYMYANHPTGGSGRFAVEIDEGKTAAGYGINFASIQSQTGYNDGKWHYLAVVRQGTSISLYIDGAIVGTSRSSAVTNVAGNDNLVIGRSLDRAIGGRYAGAACYSGPRVDLRAWSAQEISTNYASTRPL